VEEAILEAEDGERQQDNGLDILKKELIDKNRMISM